jgi:hypothetical protein
MVCTFCGTENRSDHKFCGMCGVRLERRQAERRSRNSGATLKCQSCNHINEAGLKFCGMCGSRVERRVQERRGSEVVGRVAATANAQLPTPEVASRTTTATAKSPVPKPEPRVVLPRREEPSIFQDQPADESRISGPSFLGLGTDSGGEADYLLEDEPTGGGLRKLVLVVIVMAILGLIFAQWRSSLKANPKPTPQKTEPAATPVPPQANNEPPSSGAVVPTQEGSVAAASPTPLSTGETGKNPPPQTSATPDAAAPIAQESAPENSTEAPSADAGDQPGADTKGVEEARIPDHKPSAALMRAQQYLQGRGVSQSCEQGLLYLRAAAEKNDPGAAIQMAALYSSGHCVKQDRVMAYRWFNSAHELEPANMWIQRNMDELWARMSSQERRLAGY